MKILGRVLTYAAAIFFTVLFAFPLVFMALVWPFQITGTIKNGLAT